VVCSSSESSSGCTRVRCWPTDPLVTNHPGFLPLEEVIARSDVSVVGTSLAVYAKIEVGDKPVFDVWNILARRVLDAS
jgi:hypothetical protein